MSHSWILSGGFGTKEILEMKNRERICEDQRQQWELKRRSELNQYNDIKYNRATYREAHLLLMRFEGASQSIEQGLYHLKSDFEKYYAFVTQMITIPRKYSSTFLRRELQKFVLHYSAPDILLIVYYAGPANLVGEGARRIILGDEDDNVDWFEHYRLLDNCISDVVIFLDCETTFASLSHAVDFSQEELMKNRDEHAGQTEIIAACGKGKTAPGEWYSFILVLLSSLQELAYEVDFTVADLRSALLTRKYLSEELQKDRDEFPCPCFGKLQSETRDREIRIMPFKLKGGFYSTSKDAGHSTFLQKFGPLGRLPLEWETKADLSTRSGRVHVEIKTGISHCTRPWRSTGIYCETELWRPKDFANYCQLNSYSVFTVAKGLKEVARQHLETLEKKPDQKFRTAMDAYAEWIKEFETNEKNRHWMEELMNILKEEREKCGPLRISQLPWGK